MKVHGWSELNSFLYVNAVLKILTFVGLFETINLCDPNLSETWSIRRYQKQKM